MDRCIESNNNYECVSCVHFERCLCFVLVGILCGLLLRPVLLALLFVLSALCFLCVLDYHVDLLCLVCCNVFLLLL